MQNTGDPLKNKPSPIDVSNNGGLPGSEKIVESSQRCDAPRSVDAAGDPVQVSTGNVFLQEVDYASPVGLSLVRYYNSALGTWFHNYGLKVVANSAVTKANVIRPDGKVLTFTGPSDGDWVSNSTVAEKLTRFATPTAEGATWRLVNSSDGIELYDAKGLPITVKSANGKVLQFVFDANGRLTSVQNSNGASLTFSYPFDPTKSTPSYVTTPDGNNIFYVYGPGAAPLFLSSVFYADNSSKTYLYENSSFPTHLTGVVDENGTRTSTWTYDSSGRAISTTQPGGANSATLAFNDANRTTTVTDALGAQRTVQFSQVAGRMVFTGQTLPCIGCEGDAASKMLDPVTGLVTQSTDYRGNTRVVTNDVTRSLPLVMTEASGQPLARTTSIQWHPTFRVPTLITEPGKTTAYLYDAKRNKLRQTETDTVSGASKVWQWTYDAYGNPLTITDPRGAVTTYIYNSQGLPSRVTDPMGHVTLYSQYDANGNLLQSTDPNGVVTTFGYDQRSRLTSITVNGQLTSYTYDAAGQLTRVTAPDNTATVYAYDGAHRLNSVTNGLGNVATFTLDGVGNRTFEQVKATATGQVVRQVGRAFNNLGLQTQITGQK